ncbi:hypothetical protein [Herbidospora yilanensis]|uniref:hypothetical protein n=1 Tax=Herbidospora yilanensis TaxID=354426 RepID=UPI00078267A8|nr:hypothetical protein [Herbidospora yilanensis]
MRTAPAEADRETDAFRAEPEAAERTATDPDAFRAAVAAVEREADALRAEPPEAEADALRADTADALAEPAAREADARRTEPAADAAARDEARRTEPVADVPARDEARRTEPAADVPARDDDALRADADPDAVRDDAAAPLRAAADRDETVRAVAALRAVVTPRAAVIPRAVVALRAVPERAAVVLRAEVPEAAALAVRLAADALVADFVADFVAVVEAGFPVMAEMVRSALAAIPVTRADTPRDVRAEAAFARVAVRDRAPLARPAGFRRPCSSRTCDRSRSTSSLRARSNTPSTWSVPDRTISWIPFDDRAVRDERDDDRDDDRRDLADRDESVSSMSMTAARALLVAVSVSDVAICTMPRSVWNTMRTPLSSDTPPRVRFRVVLRLNATVRW